MIYKFSVHRTESEAASEHLRRIIADLDSWKDYYIDAGGSLSSEDITALAGALCNPITERIEVDVPLPANAVQVAYKRGIVDNENDSIVALCEMLGIQAIAAKVATTYRSDDESLEVVITDEACNDSIEEVHSSEPKYDTLMPVGAYEPVRTFDLRDMNDDELVALGRASGRVLELDKMLQIKDLQLRMDLDAVSDVMLEALDARWSDHCAHTTWKSLGNLLERLIDSSRAAANPNVISMFHDNAGIWDFYDGYGIAIKPETHNGPSAVSAYFGQLTKLGGVLRDILGTGLGADPIGSFEYTATGLPSSQSPVRGRPSPRQIASDTIRAIKEYGNTFGVPMMWSHMTFHESYRAKPFALGGSIGLIPNRYANKGRPEAGDLVVLIGGLTGNDGIHGATGSSAGATMDTTAVQIGSPLEEIKFREAILVLRDNDCIRAITDLGAAGLNSAAGEMGEGTGVWMNTALVPLKTGGLPMWRILLSESQERMVLAIAPENLARAREILSQYEVRNTVIGRFTGNDRYCVVHDETISERHVEELNIAHLPGAREVGFDLPYSELTYRPPNRVVEPPRQRWRSEPEWPKLSPEDLATVAARLVRDCEIYDESFASSQYDSSVRGRSYYGPVIGERHRVPSGYCAARPVYGHDAAILFGASFNPWLFAAHPVLAARQHFLSLLTTQVLAGAHVLDVCFCDNFYTPNLDPDADSWLVGMVNEIAELAEQFRTPFISGKDSSAGSVKTDEGIVSVPPAVFLCALGKVDHVRRLRSEQWTRPGNLLVRIGLPTPSLAGTAVARALDLEANDVDEVPQQLAYTFINSLEGLSLDVAPSGRVIGPGGVLMTAALGSLASGLRAELDVPAAGCQELLQEHRIGALIEVPEGNLDAIPADLAPLVAGRIVEGAAGVPGVSVAGVEMFPADVIRAWETSFQEELA